MIIKSQFTPLPRQFSVPWQIMCLLVTLLCFATIGSAFASTKQQPQYLMPNPAQAAKIRSLAASALADVAQIRDKVHDGKTDHLWDYLTQMNTKIALIEAARPTGEIDALISYYQQHLSFEDNKQVLADISTLYRAMDALPKSDQTEKARHQLDSVRLALQKSKRAEALQALENMQRTLSIDGVDFPLQAAEEKLQTITNVYEDKRELPAGPILLELETELLQIVNSLV